MPNSRSVGVPRAAGALLRSAEPTPVVLVVGQTPPPHHGLSIMIEAMLEGAYAGLRLVHTRMAFSDRLEDVSRFRPGKVPHLLALIARVLVARRRTGASVLYYAPAGAARLPIWRDLILLGCTRWLFRKTVFHFHAGGLSTFYARLNPVERLLFRLVYDAPDLAIRTSQGAPEDGKFLHARLEAVVPNGIPDLAPSGVSRAPREGPVRLLYLSMLRETKGVLVLLEACHRLFAEGIDFTLTLAGPEAEPGLGGRIDASLDRHGMRGVVKRVGNLVGDAKLAAYREADLFVFPTFYEAETFGVVLLEAMAFALPVVATRWRATPEIVVDQVTGLLVPPRDAGALAAGLRQLIREPELRQRLGRAGRERFLAEYTLEVHRARLGQWLARVVAPTNDGR